MMDKSTQGKRNRKKGRKFEQEVREVVAELVNEGCGGHQFVGAKRFFEEHAGDVKLPAMVIAVGAAMTEAATTRGFPKDRRAEMRLSDAEESAIEILKEVYKTQELDTAALTAWRELK